MAHRALRRLYRPDGSASANQAEHGERQRARAGRGGRAGPWHAARRPRGRRGRSLEGVGLDRPFFDDKNRAFWVLQSIGWTGYFILRSLSGFANSMGAMFVVHTLLLTATGYSLTLLMASLYRRLITMRATGR